MVVASPPSPPRAAALEAGVRLTILYGDLFDHPLTADELQRYMPTPCSDRETFARLLAELCTEGVLMRDGELFCRPGREATFALRRRRARLAAPRWLAAQGFAAWLAWVPFLHMVAVCGSQAVDNGDGDGDVDLFLITAPERLWLVQAITMVLRRPGRWRYGVEICPNFLLCGDRLALEGRDLYAAREAAQTVPLWGEEAYGAFLAANRWITEFLPQIDLTVPLRSQALSERRRYLRPQPRHRLTRWLEKLLAGHLGNFLDRSIHRSMLLYYRWRLRSRGFRKPQIENAYRRDRQVVITGGYARAVARRFRERAKVELADLPQAVELSRRLFPLADDPEAPSSPAEADPLYASLFDERYGECRD